MALGKAVVDITANLKPLRAALAKAEGQVRGMIRRVGVALRRGFGMGFKAIQRALGSVVRLAKIAAAAILGIGVASVKIASDVQETDNLFRISMGSMAEEAAAFARNYSKSLNLFENDTRKALGTFQLMLTSMGIGEAEAFKMSKGLVRLTNDIASFRNQKPEDVFLKLQAGITGEAEPLKRLGILVNETVIKQLALEDATIQTRMAMKGASKELTQTEKILLRYRAIIRATRVDQGDMARTLNDTANVFRQVWAQIKVTGNTIGKELLPSITKVAIALRDWLIQSQPEFAKWTRIAVQSVGKFTDKFQEIFNLAKSGQFGKIFDGFKQRFVQLRVEAGKMFDGFKPKLEAMGESIGQGIVKALNIGLPILFDTILPFAINLATLAGGAFIEGVAKEFPNLAKKLPGLAGRTFLRGQALTSRSVTSGIERGLESGGRISPTKVGVSAGQSVGYGLVEQMRILNRNLQNINSESRDF